MTEPSAAVNCAETSASLSAVSLNVMLTSEKPLLLPTTAALWRSGTGIDASVTSDACGTRATGDVASGDEQASSAALTTTVGNSVTRRSEERRVGKECRDGLSADH